MSDLWTDEQAGPASYTTGGFTIATTLAAVDHASVFVKTPGANLPPCEFRISRSGANFTVSIWRHQADDVSSINAVSGLPSGVTAAATSGQTYDAEAAHTHDISHDHAAVTSGGVTAPAGGSTIDLTGPLQIRTHDHSFNPPNLSATSGAGASHTQAWNNIYQHQHSVTNTETNASQSELPNGTDLSGTTFIFRAVDE